MSVDLNFENSFVVSTTCLHMVRSHPSVKRDLKWALEFAVIFFLSCFSFIFLSFSLLTHDVKYGKFFDACKHGTMIIVYITVSLKYFILVYYQKSFIQLIATLDADYQTSKNLPKEDQDLVLSYVKRGARVSKFWLFAGYGTSIMFPGKAFVMMLISYWHDEFEFVPMFDMTYPGPIDKVKHDPAVFWTLFFLTCFFAAYASTIYVGFDPLVPIFMLHTCGQVDLLKGRLAKVFDNNDPKVITDELKSIIKKLQSLYAFVDIVKVNFAILYEYILKATTFILPLTAYQVIEDLRAGRINLEYTSFFVAGVIHFFLPSYYCDLLMDANEEFRQAVYASGWERCPSKEVRQIILFMLTRSYLPMGINTIFYTINLELFAEMCRQSYALLNLMNAAWN